MVGFNPHIAPLVASLIVLAGCAGKAPSDVGDGSELGVPSALAAIDLDWSMTGCKFGVILVDVPASAVQPHVPEGFRVLSVTETGLEGQVGQNLPNPRSDGNFGIEMFQCDEGAGLNGSLPGMTYASLFTGVDPPAELRQDCANHFVKWDVLMPDGPRRDQLASYGLPVHNGAASVSVPLAQGTVARYSGSMNIEDVGAFTMEGSSGAPLPDNCFVEFTQTPGGLATWKMNYALVAGGVGPQSVNVPAGSWAASIVGAGAHNGAGFAGIVDFGTGSISLPAQPAGNTTA